MDVMILSRLPPKSTDERLRSLSMGASDRRKSFPIPITCYSARVFVFETCFILA